MNDDYFLFPLGLVVHHRTATSPRYRIVDRAVTATPHLFACAPLYLLAGETGAPVWCGEREVVPWAAGEEG